MAAPPRQRPDTGEPQGPGPTEPLTLHLPPDLVRAFRRCTWILINETGRDQRTIAAEMVRDFLVKHGC